MTLTLNALFKEVNEQNPGQRITVQSALRTWAAHSVWQMEMKALLGPCGLEMSALVHILNDPSLSAEHQDEAVFSQAFLFGLAGQAVAASLLWALAEIPYHPLTREMVHRGLDLQCLKGKLVSLREEPAVLASVVSEIDRKLPTLTRFGRNLTQLAQSGAFDELYPREKEMEQLILILMKTQKGNAVITGPAGAGKTALVELLARAIAEGSVPESLQNATLFEVSLAKLLAGTMYRGQFEERLEGLLSEIKSNPSTLLFIDEMHLLWGAGRTSESAMDASNILKPYLARGEIRMIGATTTGEYHRYIAQDTALERRFEVLPLEAPSDELLLNLVRSTAGCIQAKTGIQIPEEISAVAVNLTNQYLPQRNQPDKAINLLDLAAAKARMSGSDKVTKALLMNLLADQTGQPISELDAAGQGALAGLEARINARLIGQTEAVSKVMQAIIYRRQFADSGRERNLGTFLFAGPTGVGKTELGRILAREFYGSEDRLLVVDLAEYTHSATASRLIGSAPGLVGYENPGLLAAFLHEAGSGVILFDELEKAHPDIRDFLLGILDNGRARTGKGELLSTRGCIIIATTNVLTQEGLHSKGFGFAGIDEKKTSQELLGGHFPPEFLGRFDELILFRSLTRSDLREIVNLRLDEALVRFEAQGIQVDFNRKTLIEYLLEKLEGSGARGVQRAIERYFSQPLAVQMLAGHDIHWEPKQ
ncbi:MAG: ATP-dependent Clp protease ATP-binding subunit [Anaerolineaceae bacterium]|nr:ATP-dependent Clp protease ATP-binding subunit [Anaerolineaceae bacterium]